MKIRSTVGSALIHRPVVYILIIIHDPIGAYQCPPNMSARYFANAWIEDSSTPLVAPKPCCKISAQRSTVISCSFCPFKSS